MDETPQSNVALRMSSRSGPSYDYVMLAEAAERQRLSNLYAVVVECSIPRPTKGTGGYLHALLSLVCSHLSSQVVLLSDMVSNLRLVDPSTATNPQFPDGFEMLAFSAQQHHLPTLRRSGDIIRLHRVTVSDCCSTLEAFT